VHLVGLITKKIVTMYGHMNVKFLCSLLCFVLRIVTRRNPRDGAKEI